MTASIGTIKTRVFIATGNASPVEVGTVTSTLHADGLGTGVVVSTRRWRRDLALALVVMAWNVWTAPPEKHQTTDRACVAHRQPLTRWQRRRFDRARGKPCPLCTQHGSDAA